MKMIATLKEETNNSFKEIKERTKNKWKIITQDIK